MKKIILFTCAFAIIATCVHASIARRTNTPKVRYIEPKSESVVDLSGEESLVFKWKRMPRPGGGRDAFKLEVFKGYGYDRIINETLDEDIDAVEVPSEMFEDSQLYTWQVRQRDRSTGVWSMDDRWSFTVKK